MKIQDAKLAITGIERSLPGSPFIIAHTFTRDGRDIKVGLTEGLFRSAKKGRVWKTKPFLTAFKNAAYGFDDTRSISSGGYDGIFRLSRNHRPRNEMMKKMFDQFIDRDGSEAEKIAEALDSSLEGLIPVRLVSHHLRLLGLLKRGDTFDTLILIQYDGSR